MRVRIASQRFIFSANAAFGAASPPQPGRIFRPLPHAIAGSAHPVAILRFRPAPDPRKTGLDPRSPGESRGFSTVFSTGVENFGERPNGSRIVDCGIAEWGTQIGRRPHPVLTQLRTADPQSRNRQSAIVNPPSAIRFGDADCNITVRLIDTTRRRSLTL